MQFDLQKTRPAAYYSHSNNSNPGSLWVIVVGRSRRGGGRISPPAEVRRLRRAAHCYLAEHPARLPQSLRSAPDFLVRDHGYFLLQRVQGSTVVAMWSVRSRRVGTKVSHLAGFVRFVSVRVGELVELLNRVCQWDGSVPMTVAHYRERVGVKWIMPLKVWGLSFQLVFKCWCCFTPCKDGTLCFIIVNFVVICIHRGLPSQTHHCWLSTDEDDTSGICLQSKTYIRKRRRFPRGIGLFNNLKTYNLSDFKWPKSSSTLFSRTTVWLYQP